MRGSKAVRVRQLLLVPLVLIPGRGEPTILSVDVDDRDRPHRLHVSARGYRPCMLIGQRGVNMASPAKLTWPHTIIVFLAVRR